MAHSTSNECRNLKPEIFLYSLKLLFLLHVTYIHLYSMAERFGKMDYVIYISVFESIKERKSMFSYTPMKRRSIQETDFYLKEFSFH